MRKRPRNRYLGLFVFRYDTRTYIFRLVNSPDDAGGPECIRKRTVTMNNKNNLIVIIFCCLTLFSCAWGASFTQTGKKFPPYTGPVQVFYEEPVGLSYEEIGLVSADANEVHLKATMITALKEKAAGKGANALILTGLERTDRGGDSAENKGHTNEIVPSGNTRTDLFRQKADYTARIVTMKARAIRIEPAK
jgi:hypothetical protein